MAWKRSFEGSRPRRAGAGPGPAGVAGRPKYAHLVAALGYPRGMGREAHPGAGPGARGLRSRPSPLERILLRRRRSRSRRLDCQVTAGSTPVLFARIQN